MRRPSSLPGHSPPSPWNLRYFLFCLHIFLLTGGCGRFGYSKDIFGKSDICAEDCSNPADQPLIQTAPISIDDTEYGTFRDIEVVLKNNGDDTLTFADTPTLSGHLTIIDQTCTTTLSMDESCTFTLRFTPSSVGTFSEWYSIPYSDGTTETTGTFPLEMTAVVGAEIIVAPIYPLNANWNDYVKNDDIAQDTFRQDDVACTTTDGPYYTACIHGAEKKKVSLPGETSCVGLSASDRLSAFDWQCDEDGGNISFFSSKLQSDAQLSDLIDGTTGMWRTNQVTIRRDGVAILTSEATIWWNNPVIDLSTVTDPNGATPAYELDVPSAIYYVANDFAATTSYELSTSRIAITVLDGATFSYADGADGTANCPAGVCLIYSRNFNFYWLEGHFAGDTLSRVDYVISLETADFCVLRNIDVSFAKARGLNLRTLENSWIESIYTHNNGGEGMRLYWNSDHNIVTNIRATQNGGIGIYIRNSDNGSYSQFIAIDNGDDGVRSDNTTGTLESVQTFHNQGDGLTLLGASEGTHVHHVVSANNNDSGVKLWAARNSSVTDIISVNNAFYGVMIANSSSGNFLSAVTSVNNAGNGVYIQNGEKTTLLGLVSVNNGSYGLRMTTGSDDTLLSHATLASNTDTQLFIESDNNQILDLQLSSDTDCTITGSGNNVEFAGVCQYTNTTPIAVGNPNASFVGKVSSDSVNATPHTAGVFLYNATQIDWLLFDNTMRVWGRNGGVFPDVSQQGTCTDGITCRIWDWTLTLLDNVLRNATPIPTGDDVGTMAWNAADASACALLGGSWNTPTPGDCTSPFLLHSYELIGDSVGNNNGICESNEVCMHTPNHGSYQGHGGTSAATFQDGTLTGITLMIPTTNGR